jgi:hypothetical protein
MRCWRKRGSTFGSVNGKKSVDDRTSIKQAKQVVPLRLLIGTAIKDIGLIAAVTLLMIGSWILPSSKWPWWARKVV